MAKFRKKPVIVQAYQFTKEMAEGSEALPVGVHFRRRTLAADGKFPTYMDSYATSPSSYLRELANYDQFHKHVIETLEGNMDVKIGDWIITGTANEVYPCKNAIFRETYEPVEGELK